jgi:hypothetical protein
LGRNPFKQNAFSRADHRAEPEMRQARGFGEIVDLQQFAVAVEKFSDAIGAVENIARERASRNGSVVPNRFEAFAESDSRKPTSVCNLIRCLSGWSQNQYHSLERIAEFNKARN